ncbi:unnamed protein product, partial [Amoebophrya sp. A25]
RVLREVEKRKIGHPLPPLCDLYVKQRAQVFNLRRKMRASLILEGETVSETKTSSSVFPQLLLQKGNLQDSELLVDQVIVDPKEYPDLTDGSLVYVFSGGKPGRHRWVSDQLHSST